MLCMPSSDNHARPGVDVVAGPAPAPGPGAVADAALAGVAVPGTGGAPVSDAALWRVLHGLPGVDQTGAQARAAALATRSIKREAKLWALDMAVPVVGLTPPGGADTPPQTPAPRPHAPHPDPPHP